MHLPRIRISILFLCLLSFCSCIKVWQVADTQVVQHSVEQETIAEDSTITAIIAPYRKKLNAQMDVVIGKAATTLTKQRPESTLGNWVADLLFTTAEEEMKFTPDFAIANYGGLRIPTIAEGAITVGTIYELMPFDNILVAVAIPGKNLQQLFDKMAAEGGWPISKQAKFAIDGNLATNIYIHQKIIDQKKKYWVVMPDFIANGGDNCDFLSAFERKNTNLLMRDAMINFVKKQSKLEQSIQAKLEQRVVVNQ